MVKMQVHFSASPCQKQGVWACDMDVQIQKQLSEKFGEIVRTTPPNGQRRGNENLLPVSTADLVQLAHEVENLKVFQGFTQKLKPSLTGKALLRFISSTIACPPKLRNLLVVLLFEALFGQLVAIGSPLDLQHLSSRDSNIIKVSLSFGQASIQLLPMIIWTGMFMLILVYTKILIWSLPFRVPIISILLLAPLYYFSVLRRTLSGVEVLCGPNEVPGFLFVMFAALAIAFLLSYLLTLAAFASWLYINGEEGARSS